MIIQNIVRLSLLLGICIAFMSCEEKEKNQDNGLSGQAAVPEEVPGLSEDTLKTINGVEYIHHIKYPKRKRPGFGDYMTFRYWLKGSEGKVLESAKEPATAPMTRPPYPGAYQEAIMFMGAGDSMTIFMPLSKVNAGRPKHKKIPEVGIGDTSKLRYVIKMEQVRSAEEWTAYKKEEDAAEFDHHIERDHEMFQVSAKVNNLEDSMIYLPSGLAYVERVAGRGALAKDGDEILYLYETKLLNGMSIDNASVSTVRFTLGKQRVIPGLEYYFRYLAQEGSEHLLYVPAHLAFGSKAPKGSSLQPFTPLIFQLKTVEIKRK